MKLTLKRKIEAGDIIRMAGILLFLALCVWLSLWFGRYFSEFSAESSGTFWENLRSGAYLNNLMDSAQRLTEDLSTRFGGFTAVVLTFMQFLQVVISAIPAAITSFASGMIYGVWGGLLISMIGTFFGTVFTFYLTRLLGRRVLTLFVSRKNIEKMEGFIDADTSMLVMLVLFIIPSPKDFFPFFVGLTKIKAWKFLLISVIGRIPGMFVTAYLGATVANRNWGVLIGFTLFAVAASACFVIFNGRLMRLLKGRQENS